NSSDLSKTILVEVYHLVTKIILPVATIIARAFVIIAILILLMVTDPLLSISAGLILGSAFGVIYFGLRKWLLKIGNIRLEAQGKRYKIVNEAFSGIKNIKLTGHETTYARFFRRPSKEFSRCIAKSGV